MERTWRWSVVVLLFAAAARSQETLPTPPKPGVLKHDLWETAQIEGGRAGWFHTTVREIERDGKTVLQTNQELNLTVRRFGEVIQLRMESGTEETPDGKVRGVSMKMFQSEGHLVLSGTVKDNVLHVEINRGGIKRQIPWNDKVIGLYAQDQLFKKNKAKSGDKFTFQTFEPTVNAVVTVRATVEAEEEVVVLGKKQKLLRAVLASDKLEVPGTAVQLPSVVLWLDQEGTPVRRQVEIQGLGTIVLNRTTREAAMAPIAPGSLVDIGLKALIPVQHRIATPHATSGAVYRITIDDESPRTALAQDARQKIVEADGKTLTVDVRALRHPPEQGEGEAGEEFAKSSYYIDSDNEQVKKLARQAAGDATDPWKRAQGVERWVHNNMQLDNAVQFGPASQVARQLRGDCRQHAVLTAALCRAAGVPSRTSVGLVYADGPGGKPVFGFHMWVEVWVRGQWVAIDSTLGKGSIGAAHIKIADHSWHNTQSLTPLLPVARVLGKMKIEVVQTSVRRE